MHTFPNGKKYIGITCRKPELRWRNGNGYSYNQYLKNAIEKYGWDNVAHEVLMDNLTREQAESWEIALIAQHRSNCRKYGYNIANGGKTAGMTSDETRLKQSKIKLENPSQFSNICKYSLDGKFICEYKSVAMAARDVNVSVNSIFQIFRGGAKISAGFQWKISDGSYDDIPCYNPKLNYNYKKMCKRIAQYTFDGDLVAVYDSGAEMERKTGICRKHIPDCCNGKRKSVGGYIWKYAA
jgi:hypothetical protein